jgi:hypothetical protein
MRSLVSLGMTAASYTHATKPSRIFSLEYRKNSGKTAASVTHAIKPSGTYEFIFTGSPIFFV